jgi:hypothetical protein
LLQKTEQKTINKTLEYKLDTKHEEASQNKIHHNFKLEATILMPDVATALPYHKMWIRKLQFSRLNVSSKRMYEISNIALSELDTKRTLRLCEIRCRRGCLYLVACKAQYCFLHCLCGQERPS